MDQNVLRQMLENYKCLFTANPAAELEELAESIFDYVGMPKDTWSVFNLGQIFDEDEDFSRDFYRDLLEIYAEDYETLENTINILIHWEEE